MKRGIGYIAAILFVFLLLSCHQPEGTDTKYLEEGFINPPQSAKPKTWMHAMSSNMSKEGLTKDLESMAEVGIGGLLLFNVTQGIPKGNITYNSDEHQAMIKHAAQECERLGLSFGVHNCDGWSASGGPWISPEESMKMVVWSETIVKGGDGVDVQLEKPTTREGFYKDIAVLAYPSLSSELDDFENTPVISSSDKEFNTSIATDNRIEESAAIEKANDKNPWIQFEYKKVKSVRSIFMVFEDRGGEAELQISEDGKNFTSVRKLSKVRTGKGEWAINDHFDAVTSNYFRLQLNGDMKIKEVKLLATYNINNPLGRTSIARTEDVALDPIGTPEVSMVIDPKSILDISSKMNTSGWLYVDLPEGDWTIMRFGYTSTGAFNNPASDEGRGLEVDKLSRPAFKKHYDAFVKKVVDNTKPVAPNALQYVEIDSYEMGGQNWTENFDESFKADMGYDFIPFLPVVAGRFVENAKISDAVLWDYRTLISDMMTENYFGYFAELCKADGLKSYIEPYGFGPLNDLEIGGKADIPMGEFWMNRPLNMVSSAVSSAHIYGKPVISAESFTSTPEINWKGNPAMAKISGDRAWALGINEFMFHRFAHQANPNVEPGMTMNRWGFHFDRTQTWWKNAGAAWFKYIARGSFMLRQGVPVSDLLVFVGDGAPNSTFDREALGIPSGYNFDCVNADVLLNRVTIDDGKLVLPEGTSYRMLVLKNVGKIKLETLKRIHQLSKEGITIVGEKPEQLAGYHINENEKSTFKNLVDEIWASKNTISGFDWQSIFTKNKLTPDFSIADRKDIDFMHRTLAGAEIYFFANTDSIPQNFDVNFRITGKIPEQWNPMNGDRKLLAQFEEHNNGTHISISLAAEESVFIVFRESSKGIVSILSPSDGIFELTTAHELQATVNKEGTQELSLSNGNKVKLTVKDIPKPIGLEGSWQVQFEKRGGYEGLVPFDSLIDWRHHPDENIRYYSGTATYTKSFSVPTNSINPETKIQLDLGSVNIVADVIINGKQIGACWMPPFVVDVTDAIESGENKIEIEITNQWSNRLIGEERYPSNDGNYKLEGQRPKGNMPAWYVNNEPVPAGKRTTFTTAPFYKVDDPLMPSGLIGPVQFLFSKQVIVEVQ